MSEREGDIEFDFFEESETREAAAEERPRRRGGRPPVRPPTGLTPLLRLVGLISFAILIVLLLVLWVNGCREDQRKNSYKNYVEKVSDLAGQSDRIGRRFNTLLTSRGKKESAVEQELEGLGQQQSQLAVEARGLDPPGHLRTQHEHVVETFDLRVNGLNGMAAAFKSTASSKNANRAGGELARQMERLVASDVIWADFFKEPTKDELRRLSVTGVDVPDSTFVVNPDIATTASMKQVWERIHNTSTGGAQCTPRGTMIVSVKALPANQELTSETNTIQQRQDLAFAVTVENSGCAQEVRVPVRLTIQQSPKPLTGRQTIDLINPQEQKTVIFRDLGLPTFERTSLTVEVDPVPDETKTDNNTASYPVQFSVG